MTLPKPHPGLVICYSYLWYSEYQQGRSEGVKNRPCAIVVANDKHDVMVVPVTHSPPTDLDVAVEIPQATKKRLGLDCAKSWIIIDEVNKFKWPGVDLCPISTKDSSTFDYGVLPPRLFNQVKEKLLMLAQSSRLKQTKREA